MSMMRWNGLREQSESAGRRTQGGDPSSNIIKAVILTTTYTTKYKSRGTTNIIVCGGILPYYKQSLPSFHEANRVLRIFDYIQNVIIGARERGA